MGERELACETSLGYGSDGPRASQEGSQMQARLMTERHQLRGPICLSRHSRGETGGVWILKGEQ